MTQVRLTTHVVMDSSKPVKIVKKVLKKAKRFNSDVNLALLCLQATPIIGQQIAISSITVARKTGPGQPFYDKQS